VQAYEVQYYNSNNITRKNWNNLETVSSKIFLTIIQASKRNQSIFITTAKITILVAITKL